MELQTISQVSKMFGISTRMLRYYEQIGLIKSFRKEENAYRVYDGATLQQLQQIIIFRKLRLSVKQITFILNNPDSRKIVDIFMQNIKELDSEIKALSAIKKILTRLADELLKHDNIRINTDLLKEPSVISIVETLSFTNNHIKELIPTDDLNHVAIHTQKHTDVRVIYVPPMAVATSYVRGGGCEGKARTAIKRFAKEHNLFDIKPDARCFGIGCDDVDLGDGGHYWRYEFCISIPDDMYVPEPYVKKNFTGGLYAAYPVSPSNGSDWDESWGVVMTWLAQNGKYVADYEARFSPHGIGIYTGGMEEILNFGNMLKSKTAKSDLQFDLLAQIKE